LSNSSEDNGVTVLEYNYSVTEMLLDAPLLAFLQLGTTSLQGRKAGPTWHQMAEVEKMQKWLSTYKNFWLRIFWSWGTNR